MPHPRWQLDSNMELKAYDATGGLNLADPMTLAALQGLQGRGGLIQLPQQYPQGIMLQAGAGVFMDGACFTSKSGRSACRAKF
jgi:hypothetical protein